MITFGELALESSMRFWTLTGPNAVVKVLSLAVATGPDAPKSATGYLTQAKFLIGLNSLEIERDLGLRPQYLKQGGFVCYLRYLPRADQVEYRYGASMPDGKIWTAEMHDKFDKARREYTGLSGEVVEGYPPGAPEVLQWRLTDRVEIPFSGIKIFLTAQIPFFI